MTHSPNTSQARFARLEQQVSRSRRRLFSMCKWYVDTLLPDGSVLLVYLGRLVVCGVPLVRVTAELFGADGGHLAGHAAGGRLELREDGLRCGQASVQGERLRFMTPTLSGELVFRPRYGAVAPAAPLVKRAGGTLEWAVEVLDADVQGELRTEQGTRSISGRGYRDRVLLDIPPPRLGLRSLRWGRAATASHASTWLRADTTRGPLAFDIVDGVVSAVDGEPSALHASRTLLQGPIVDLTGLHLGPLRGLLRALGTDPYQHKWAATGELRGEVAQVVHEQVDFEADGARRNRVK